MLDSKLMPRFIYDLLTQSSSDLQIAFPALSHPVWFISVKKIGLVEVMNGVKVAFKP